MGDGASEVATALAAIAARDPGFDVEAFLSQATDVFLAVRRGRTSGDVDGLRVSVATTAWSALGLDQSPDGASARPDVAEPEVLKASTGAMDSITVRFRAADDQGREVTDWTFQRPGTARTKRHTTECPHCGATGSYGSDGRCTYCHKAMTPDSWQVTRATSATAAEAPLADRHDLVRAVTAALEAQGATGDGDAPVRRRSRGCLLGTVFRVLALLVVVAAGVAVYGWLVPDSPVHEPVAKLIPATARAQLEGEIVLAGEVAGAAPFEMWWSSPVACRDLAAKTSSISMTGTLPDGATTKVDIRTTGVDLTPPLTGMITAVVNYDHSTNDVHQVWQTGTVGSVGAATITVAGDGSGEAAFQDLPPGLTTPTAPQTPLAGTVRWTCQDR